MTKPKPGDKAPESLDPIAFEVIKHRLWQINDEQSIAIRTISSSPIVVEGNDFNVGLFTAEGQLTTAGIGSLVHVGTMGDVLRTIMKRAGHIRDGDVFLTNDPFLGALHQNDVVLASPLFRDGQIVLWVGNVLHHPDVGGIDEGSFCVNAFNLYQEPARYFLKIVDQNELVTEVEHTFVTNSRLPDMVALDLRAQLGAIHAAKTRLNGLLDELGVAAVQSVMNRAIDVAEEQARDRISRLPEGSWTGEAYMDGAKVGDERIYIVKVKLTRSADSLHFDFTGSSPQVDAAVNCTYHATVAGAVVPLYAFLCQGEIDWNDGLKRCVRVTAPAGTVVNATFPAPVSICTVGFRWLVTVAAAQAVAKMLNASADYRDRVCPSWNVSSNCNNLFGTTPEGKRVGALLSDHRAGGASARSFDDGFSHAGQVTSYASTLGNIEGAEWKLPLLYVYRRQLPDSGGAGQFRGGLTAAAAVVPFGVSELTFKSTNTSGIEESNAHGIDGGYPGAGSQVTVIRETRVWELIRSGRSPLSYDEFAGVIEHLPSKASGTLGPEDVMVFFPPGGGGYGDPLDREPERVAQDVVEGRVSLYRAHEIYGVEFTTDRIVDVEATRVLRDELRRGRCRGDVADWNLVDSYCHPKPDSGKTWPIGENLGIAPGSTGAIICRRCEHVLTGPQGSVLKQLWPLSKAGPWLALRWQGDSPNFKLEAVSCPSCGVQMAVREIFLNRSI
jgi:N-methylhydantoinase B